MRFVALRLLEWGMRDKDVRYLCGVADYFLINVAQELAAAGKRSLTKDGRVRRGGSAPGVWSICRNKQIRREAAMFVQEWVVAGQPFDKKPDPIAFEAAYRRYRDWGWREERRQRLSPSACLTVIRNIGCGELALNRCLMCERRSVQAATEHGGGRHAGNCSFCDSPHKVACPVTPDHRVVNPA